MTDFRFPEVPGGYPFPQLELEILARWERDRVLEQSLHQTAAGREYVFYEGPPTANNKPHVGHVVTRVVKDLFPRFHTMRGEHVARKGGWDTHGLPVEIEVEKRLGFTGKQQIEEYGIAEFNRDCLESVHTYERQWRAMTERVGYWIEMDDPYLTYSNRYIESVWWALKQLWTRDLLAEGYKIQPYCARCGTTLSSHEVAQNYGEIEDPSVWVLFPVRPDQQLVSTTGERWDVPEGLQIVAWTTTPWSLLGNAGLAVNPELTYLVVRHPSHAHHLLLFAEGLDTEVPSEVDTEAGKRKRLDLRAEPPVVKFSGADLVGLRYDRPFNTSPADSVPEASKFSPPPSDEAGWCVLPGDYVTATEGTGVVHTAPAFGEDDYRSAEVWGLPFFLTVAPNGEISSRDGIDQFSGVWFKDADRQISGDLKRRGLLLHSQPYRHSYPFCWRCDRPLIYYASKSWFVKTTTAKDRLIELNQTIGWRPAHVRDGRFGNWLENIVDWALSRKRYWGTPLPVWSCDQCDYLEVIGSFSELFQRTGKAPPADLLDRSQFDPHRPFVDRSETSPFVWPCPSCDHGTVGRVEDVIDAWFDSGAMFFAQHHYPFENQELFAKQFPADFISEAVDQTRGWFYTLHVLATLLFDSVAYKNCVVLGHINDDQGRKMSKRLGNVVDPMAVIEKTGADALRWYFCISNPEVGSRFSEKLVRESAQSFQLPLWNALSFFTIYANLDGWRPGANAEVPFVDRPSLDRWLLLRLDQVIDATTLHLEGYRIAEAARAIEDLVDDLTNWYIRRSRSRFWSGDQIDRAVEKESAYQTLYEVLTIVAKLIAPFTPFLGESLHIHLSAGLGAAKAPSIHLTKWPERSRERADSALLDGMAAVQRIVNLGRSARNTHELKTRQPLAGVTLVSTDSTLPALVAPHLDLLLEELNVGEISWATTRSDYVHHQVRPVFPKCGPRFGKLMKQVQKALAEGDGDRLAETLERHGRITIEINSEKVELSNEEVEIVLEERAGTATQGDRELLVALDTTLTPALILAGWAREVVHRVQSARKDAALEYADRIRIRYRAAPDLETAIAAHRKWISAETLAVEVVSDNRDSSDLLPHPVDDLQFDFAIDKIG